MFLLLLCLQGLAQEKSITQIEFKGLKKSKPQYLKDLLSQKKDQPYDTIKVKSDLIVLLREPAVSHAFTSLDSLVDLDGFKKGSLVFGIDQFF